VNVAVADSFYKSLSRLTREEQDRVRETAFLFLQNPKHPSLKMHKLEKLKNKGFWSVYVNMDLRIILYEHREVGFILAYTGHHDDAYLWAENHQAEVHPRTGILQIFRVVEETKVVPREIRPLLPYPEDYLLDLGVPPSYLKPLSLVETEEELLELISGLPQDVQERLLDLCTGKKVVPPPKVRPLRIWPSTHSRGNTCSSSRTWRSSAGPSPTPGSGGWSSSIPPSGRLWSAPSRVRPGSRAQRARAKPWWPSTGRPAWRSATPESPSSSHPSTASWHPG